MTAGTEVRIRGRLDWYAPRGQLQLRMTAIDPAYTLGQLEVARAELLRRLDEEGLLRANAALALPAGPAAGRARHQRGVGGRGRLPRRAAAQRASPSTCSRADTRVQGADAARVDRVGHPDARHPPASTCSRVVRGGGARTDLAAFDDEAVARAIAAARSRSSPASATRPTRSVADEVAHTVGQDAHRLRPAAGGAASRDLADGLDAAVGRHRRAVACGASPPTTSALVAPRHRHLARALRGWPSTASAARLDGVAEPRRAGRRWRGLDAAGRRLDGHSGRITGAARSHLRAAEVQVDAARRRHRPPGAHGPWPTPSGRSAALDARAARPRSRAHPGPGLVDHPAARRPGASGRPDDVAPGDALTTVARRRRGPLYGVTTRWLSPMADAPPTIGYADALAELEAILEEIEDDAVDVDVLAARVKRAPSCSGCAAPGSPRPRSRSPRSSPSSIPTRPTADGDDRAWPPPSYDARAMIRPSIPVPPSLLTVAERVEDRLDAFLTAETRPLGGAERRPRGAARVAAPLVMGGGKRLRPAFCYWGYVAAGGDPDDPQVIDAGAAFEMLQAFALVHDDVMDGSRHPARRPHRPPRRTATSTSRPPGAASPGASARASPSSSATSPTCTPTSCSPARPPTVQAGVGRAAHRAQRRPVPRHPRHRPARHRPRGAPAASPATSRASTRSSGRCTSAPRWPAGSSDLQAALSAYGDPLGEAFQLRDDLLGVFGEESATGKPVGDDLREGKPTPLLAVATAQADAAQAAVLAEIGRARPHRGGRRAASRRCSSPPAPSPTIEATIDALTDVRHRRHQDGRDPRRGPRRPRRPGPVRRLARGLGRSRARRAKRAQRLGQGALDARRARRRRPPATAGG